MDQPALFHERIEQAVDEVIAACGGRKAFAAEMWPEKSHRDAHNLLDACLNPERREKFAPEQLLYILRRGRAARCDGLMRYLSREAGYEDPKPIEPKDEEAKLIDAIVRATEALNRASARLEQLRRPPLQTVGR